MQITHLTPHVPPDQAANALLPFHLGVWAGARGDTVTYLAHKPRAGAPRALPGAAVWVPATREYGRLGRGTRVASLLAAAAIVRAAWPIVRRTDLVHVHGNGLLAEIGAWVAHRQRKPVVLTLYGTEIWHYTPRRIGPDLFTSAYRRAALVTFYSQRLLDRARGLGLGRDGLEVVYPAVAAHFARADDAARQQLRERLRIGAAHVLVNVKRLHPLAGQRYLVEALPDVLRTHPDTQLFICGTGPLEDELQRIANQLGVDANVAFTGLLDNADVAGYCAAADVFVLPSLLEALPTVAVEALACGTRVVSADHPGGLELHALFDDDVKIVPRRNPVALARAIRETLDEHRRTSPRTETRLDEAFRPAAVWRRYAEIYARALAAAPAASGAIPSSSNGLAK